jgi:hypothetical protein
VRDLKVQAAVKEFDPFVTDDVHRRAQLSRNERFRRAEVGRGSGEMREHDLSTSTTDPSTFVLASLWRFLCRAHLNVHRTGYDMANEQVSDPHLPPVQTLQEHPEPGPEEHQSSELEREPLVPRHLER